MKVTIECNPHFSSSTSNTCSDSLIEKTIILLMFKTKLFALAELTSFNEAATAQDYTCRLKCMFMHKQGGEGGYSMSSSKEPCSPKKLLKYCILT